MTRRMFLCAPLAAVRQEPRTVTLAMGIVSAADHELADGYIAIGQGTAIMVKPQSVGWLHLRELRDRTITLLARVDR